jgi:hypothetical protein
VNLSVLMVGSFVVSYLNKCLYITFFAIWFRARMRVRWVVFDVWCLLWFSHLLGLVLQSPVVVELNVLSLNATWFTELG